MPVSWAEATAKALAVPWGMSEAKAKDIGLLFTAEAAAHAQDDGSGRDRIGLSTRRGERSDPDAMVRKPGEERHAFERPGCLGCLGNVAR